jgi:UDP-3-O-acyl-N-acetylglucosamine deacetylase
LRVLETQRKTLKETITLEGRGLQGGQPVTVRIHPGDDGIAFRHGTTRVPAIAENVTDTTRCTRLGEISTIEHAMSALAGLEVTDAELELSSPELPGLDGSALVYVEAMLATGLVDLGAQESYPPFKRAFFQEDAITIAAARGEGHWRFEYLTGERWPHSQVFESADVIGVYAAEIAPARTIALSEEVPFLLKMGLGQGLDETSALIIGSNGYDNAARFADEPARHKLLDLIGDLYLSGIPIRLLNVVAVRSGHRTNVAFAKQLTDAAKRERSMG